MVLKSPGNQYNHVRGHAVTLPTASAMQCSGVLCSLKALPQTQQADCRWRTYVDSQHEGQYSKSWNILVQMQGVCNVEFFTPRFPRHQCHFFAVVTLWLLSQCRPAVSAHQDCLSRQVSSASRLAAAHVSPPGGVAAHRVLVDPANPKPAGTARLDQTLVMAYALSQLITPSCQWQVCKWCQTCPTRTALPHWSLLRPRWA